MKRHHVDTHRKPSDLIEIDPSQVVYPIECATMKGRYIGVVVKVGKREVFLVNHTNLVGSVPGEKATYFLRKRRPGKATAKAYILRDYVIPVPADAHNFTPSAVTELVSGM